MAQQPEPWLRGTINGLHPVAAHMFYTFEQTREELERFCSRLTVSELWRPPMAGVASVGFHLRHIAGSVDRLSTYLRGEPLSEAQLAFLKQEQAPGATYGELLASLQEAFAHAEALARPIPPSQYADARTVGRRQLPTSVGGLIVHLSEHTQRHLGQVVLTAKLVTGTAPQP